jgi:hypothetical protein
MQKAAQRPSFVVVVVVIEQHTARGGGGVTCRHVRHADSGIAIALRPLHCCMQRCVAVGVFAAVQQHQAPGSSRAWVSSAST